MISLSRFFPKIRFKPTTQRYRHTVEKLLTPFDKALVEIERRRKDPELIAKVTEYLDGDIPRHFNRSQPICYLSRHVATANEETLHFIQFNSAHGHTLPVVIGQDLHDIFVPDNILKHNLGKLPIVRGFTKTHEQIIEKVTILDFNTANGQRLSEIETLCDISLVDFHTKLLRLTAPNNFELANESDWVDRHHRGDLLAHYQKLLALLVVHGIMFEFYETKDASFVYDILAPAYEATEERFGCAPLITHLVPQGQEHERDWNAYPSSVYPCVKQCANGATAGQHC